MKTLLLSFKWPKTPLVCPDSNIILERVFVGSKFRNQVNFFCDRCKESETTTIILPKIHREVSDVIRAGAGFFVDAVNQYRKSLRVNIGSSLDQVKVDRRLLADISPLNPQIQKTLGSSLSSARRQMVQQAVGDVETALVRKIYQETASGTSHTHENLDSLFKDLASQIATTYTVYNDTYASTTKEIRASRVPLDAFYPSGDFVDQMLSVDCGVENERDRAILAEAIGVMFTSNLWTVLVTNDRGDLLSNQKKIEEKSLLTVSNPLYAFEEVLNRTRSGKTPIQAARDRSVDYAQLVRLPQSPLSVV